MSKQVVKMPDPEAGGADHDLLQGKQLLGVDGLVDGNEVGSEMGDRLEVFEPDDGEPRRRAETMRAGILGGAGLALGGARADAPGGVGAVGSELLFGNGHK